MQLVLSAVKYRESFLEALKEFATEERRARSAIDGMQKLYEESLTFGDFLEKLRRRAEGKHLPEGYVPHTTYWLVEGTIFVGVVDIRHRLTPHLLEIGGHTGYAIRPSKRGKGYGNKILELALSKAKELGITKVRVTCNEDNVASAKIIEKSGGIFDGAVFSKEENVMKRRYWIYLS